MMSLRKRLWMGFGGVLLILATVCILSVGLINRYNSELHRVMRQNHDSLVYCDEMQLAVHRLHESATQAAIVGSAPLTHSDVQSELKRFETNMALQVNNSYLPGELEGSRQLGTYFNTYRTRYLAVRAGTTRPSGIDDILESNYQSMMQSLEVLSTMNLRNMASVNQDLQNAGFRVRNTVIILAAVGLLVTVAYIVLVARTMLAQLKALTQSAEHIAGGDLDATVPVRSQDEFGQLANTFNTMASKLREFRRDDEAKLTRTRHTTQQAIDSLLEPVLVTDPQGRIEIANRAATRLFGLKTGHTVADAPAWLAELHRSVMSGEVSAAEGYESAIQVFDKGQELFLLPGAVPMYDASGQTIGVTIILLNVTQLRHADELKSGLLSTVSHELRTPLTGLQMSVNLLQEPEIGELNAKQRELLSTAIVSSDRLYRVIEHLLSISRIESGKVPLQLQNVAPSTLVWQACDAHQAALADRKIELVVNVPTDLPEVKVDPASVHYVFTNLLSNARKYTPPGGRITVSAREEDESVVFSVADTGPGIPLEYQQSVFEKFFRIPTPDGPTGAGLGLSIAREIVIAHGGAIEVKTPDGGGSDFQFKLPKSVNGRVEM